MLEAVMNRTFIGTRSSSLIEGHMTGELVSGSELVAYGTGVASFNAVAKPAIRRALCTQKSGTAQQLPLRLLDTPFPPS